MKKDSAPCTMKMKRMMNGYHFTSGYKLTLISQIRFDIQNKIKFNKVAKVDLGNFVYCIIEYFSSNFSRTFTGLFSLNIPQQNFGSVCCL